MSEKSVVTVLVGLALLVAGTAAHAGYQQHARVACLYEDTRHVTEWHQCPAVASWELKMLHGLGL